MCYTLNTENFAHISFDFSSWFQVVHIFLFREQHWTQINQRHLRTVYQTLYVNMYKFSCHSWIIALCKKVLPLSFWQSRTNLFTKRACDMYSTHKYELHEITDGNKNMLTFLINVCSVSFIIYQVWHWVKHRDRRQLGREPIKILYFSIMSYYSIHRSPFHNLFFLCWHYKHSGVHK